MTQTITNEAIEAAARAIASVQSCAPEDGQHFMDEASAALTAALPHLSASDDVVAVKHREHAELTGTICAELAAGGAVELGPDGKEWAKTEAGYAHVDKVKGRADGFHGMAPWFYGWAVREAFVAGAEWQEKRAQPPQATDEAAKGGADRKTLIDEISDEDFAADASVDMAIVSDPDGLGTPAPSEATSGDVALWAMLEKHIASYQAASPGITRDAALSALLTLKSALASLDQPEARKTGSADGALRVKPLEWDNYVEPPFVAFARTPFGTYQVKRGTAGSGWWWWFSGNMGDEGHGSEDEAKAAAQADFERRAALSHSDASTHSPTSGDRKTDGADSATTGGDVAVAIKGSGFDPRNGGFTIIHVGDREYTKDEILAALKSLAGSAGGPGEFERGIERAAASVDQSADAYHLAGFHEAGEITRAEAKSIRALLPADNRKGGE